MQPINSFGKNSDSLILISFAPCKTKYFHLTRFKKRYRNNVDITQYFILFAFISNNLPRKSFFLKFSLRYYCGMTCNPHPPPQKHFFLAPRNTIIGC